MSERLPRRRALVPAWDRCRALHERDSTRVYPGELPDMRPIRVRTDMPPARPLVFLRRRREQLAETALAAVLVLATALWIAFLLWAGAHLAHWLADAAARLVTGAH